MRWNRCLPALALLLFLPARADEPPPTVTPAPKEAAKKIAKKPAALKTPAPGAANMVVTRDPETGELRNATAAERAKLFAGRAPQAAPAAPRVVILPNGTEMVELGEDTMNYAIATKAPDGSIKQSCVHGPDSATEARTAPKPAPAPRAEER
jgi:hypothetical protein